MLETLGMPSASDARYGAPPEASRSPLRFSSSVNVTRSMACCTSPSAIICVNTRRCWSRKKSSGRRCSIAGFSAWLSSKIAPRTERSASRLFGSGFSRVVSTGMRGLLYIRLFFAFVLRSAREGQRRISHPRYEHFLVQSDAALCVELPRASIGVPVHRLGNLCKTFLPLSAQSCSAAICAGFRATSIQVLGVNRKKTESLDGQDESGTGAETQRRF